MRIFIIIISLFLAAFLATSAFAEVKLWHYTDKTTGDEMGVSYSDKDGNPPINNPDWNGDVIGEKDKDKYIKLQTKQHKDKQDAEHISLKTKRKIIKDKLKAGQSLSQADVDILVGESD